MKNKIIIMLKWIRQYIFRIIPDKLYLKIVFRIKVGRRLNLKSPKTFNEKLQWLKLYNRNPEYTAMADKYKVREYVRSKIGEEYLIPLIGVYDKFDDINFDKLPNQFVIKCNHDSGSVVICKDKKNFDINAARKKINRAMRYNYYYVGREWQYKNIERKIIIEEYLSKLDGYVKDYKFFVFNNHFAYSFICSNRQKKVKFTFFDKDGKFIDVKQGGADYDKKVELPKNYNKMISLAEKLAKGIPELRVDFYEVDGKIYFGELTFFDASGFDKFEPEKWDETFGSLLKLPKRRDRNGGVNDGNKS